MRPITRQSPLDEILAAADQVILGKSRQTRLALCCLLAKGHLLIEDLPGVGKTTLAHTLARLLGFQFSRVQFTSDMLPADILGVSVFDRDRGDFRFLPGPVFSQVLLADEINRATPKTQSALLEAMEEGQVTTEGETRPCRNRFSSLPRRIPRTRSAPSPCPNRSSIASCCASNSATRTTPPNARCSKAAAAASNCRR
jgi:MoxR-like ATPase